MKPVDPQLKTATSRLKYFVLSERATKNQSTFNVNPPSAPDLHILYFTDVISETETHFFLVKFLNSTSENMNQKRPVFEFLIQGALRELTSHDSLSSFGPVTVEMKLLS